MNRLVVVLAVVLAVVLGACSPNLPAQVPDGLQGTLVVLNKSGHDASFIDLASGEITATLPTGRGPHELIITSDGRWAIGTDYAGGNSLTVFDVPAQRVVRTIDLSDYTRPHGIVFLPGEEQVLVTSEGSRNLVVVDIQAGSIESVISTEQHSSHMVAISSDGAKAFTVNGSSNSVSVVDMQSLSLDSEYPVPDRPEAIQTNKDGTEIWVGSNDNEVVTVLSAATGEQLAQWDGFSWPYRVLLTRDERMAIMPDLGNESLRFFDAQAKEEIARLDLTGTRPQGVVLHPDDRTLFLSLSGTDQVMVIDIETRETLGFYPTGSAPDGIGYSPLVAQ